LSFIGSYNFFDESLQLSPLVLSARSNLFNKINITASGTLDPYQVNGLGQRVDALLWQRKVLTLGRLVNGNVSLSTQLQGGNKKTGSTKPELKPNDVADIGYTPDQYNTELAYIRNNPGEYADFNIPWSLNLNYSLTFSKTYYYNLGFVKTFAQNVNFGGTLNITPKWQTAVNGYYDITQGVINQISMSISREMHCWQMSISLSPVGIYRSFSISISPKSPLLRDLRINRTRSSYNGI
jgi:LPS-assembly protein